MAKIFKIISLSVLGSLAITAAGNVAFASIIMPEVKTIECSGKKFQLWLSSSNDFAIFEYSKAQPTKENSSNVRQAMFEGQDIFKATLDCENGSLKITFPENNAAKNQSLLVTNSGRVMDVTTLYQNDR